MNADGGQERFELVDGCGFGVVTFEIDCGGGPAGLIGSGDVDDGFADGDDGRL